MFTHKEKIRIPDFGNTKISTSISLRQNLQSIKTRPEGVAATVDRETVASFWGGIGARVPARSVGSGADREVVDPF